MTLSTALQCVIEDLRRRRPGRNLGLQGIDVIDEWLDDGVDHTEIDTAVAVGRIDEGTADAYHLVLEVGHGPIQTVLLGTPEQAAEVDAWIERASGVDLAAETRKPARLVVIR